MEHKMTLSRWHKKIYNAETGEETFIELNAEEVKVAEAEETALLGEIKKHQDAKAIKDAARQVILDKLGITQEEASLLLS